MTDAERMKARWRAVLDRTGAAGRQWRKTLAMRALTPIECAPDAAYLAALKSAIKSARQARAQGHWSFKPDRLRRLLALYVEARRRQRASPEVTEAPGPPDIRRPH